MAHSKTNSTLLEWKEVNADGPSRAFHTGSVVGNCLYIHGGVTTKDSKQPTDSLFKLNSSTWSWSEISCPGSPSLSHHASVSLDNRYFMLIGGWNGKARTSNIFIFDTQKNFWIPIKVSGFPEGGGLSSHTATLLENGDILILGREGSLRTQRRHGSGYMISGSVATGEFVYKEYTQSTASRSGHTASICGDKLYVIGGRDNNLIERHAGFRGGAQLSPATTKLNEAAARLSAVKKIPCGRKNHIAVSASSAVFIHGGETFDGRSREPVGEMYIYSEKPSPTFYIVGVSDIGRAGHVCGVIEDKILMHGGTGGRNSVFGNTFELYFNF